MNLESEACNDSTEKLVRKITCKKELLECSYFPTIRRPISDIHIRTKTKYLPKISGVAQCYTSQTDTDSENSLSKCKCIIYDEIFMNI